MLINVLARLHVVESKLNELLKRFGEGDEDLWDLGEHIFHKSIKRLQEQERCSEQALEQPELF